MAPKKKSPGKSGSGEGSKTSPSVDDMLADLESATSLFEITAPTKKKKKKSQTLWSTALRLKSY